MHQRPFLQGKRQNFGVHDRAFCRKGDVASTNGSLGMLRVTSGSNTVNILKEKDLEGIC